MGGVRKEFVRPDLNIYIFNSGNGKLYFSEVTTADNGYYYCVATLTNVNENDNYDGASQQPSRTSQGILLNVTGSGESIQLHVHMFIKPNFSNLIGWRKSLEKHYYTKFISIVNFISMPQPQSFENFN